MVGRVARWRRFCGERQFLLAIIVTMAALFFFSPLRAEDKTFEVEKDKDKNVYVIGGSQQEENKEKEKDKDKERAWKMLDNMLIINDNGRRYDGDGKAPDRR
jgi:hypothetical protein